MAGTSYTTLNPGTGGDNILDEDIGGSPDVKVAVSKLHTGALGVDGGPVGNTNPLPGSITDGTNGVVAVKAASTAAVATDIAQVVSLSPNSHVKASVQALYGTNGQTITCTLASLASAAARQCTAVDNTSNLFEDAHVFVQVKTAASGVSTTGYIQVYGYATVDNGATYTEGMTGSDASATLASPSNLVLLAQLTANVNATTYSAEFSFCTVYGLLVLPAKWGIVVVNLTGAAFDATEANHKKLYQGVNRQLT